MGNRSLPDEKGAALNSAATATNPEAGQCAPIATRLGIPTLYMMLGNVFTLAVGLPLQIYIARVLGPAGVGIYGLLEAAMSTAAGFLGLGVGITVMRFVPEHLARREFGEAVGLIRGSAFLVFVTGGLAYGVPAAFTPVDWHILVRTRGVSRCDSDDGTDDPTVSSCFVCSAGTTRFPGNSLHCLGHVCDLVDSESRFDSGPICVWFGPWWLHICKRFRDTV